MAITGLDRASTPDPFGTRIELIQAANGSPEASGC
ncbi:hypothetical protein GETHPA_02510 [Geothrix rubra]|uniref:Uncharacterized protein n=1 Tax=Geothrix rubra TaxID=2927977 RepID=A0ABQ5Q296_9BACT|nr:hypothetical protein GETHPA_02510 [Geothrix rubra]